MNNWKTLGSFIVIIGIIGIAGVLWRKNPVSVSETPKVEKTESVASSTAPSLVRQVKYSADLSPDARRILGEHISKLSESLSNNVDDFGSWMNLAIQYKTAGDYEGAQKVWEYISYLHPGEGISLHNLGDLYHHYLKDFAKAEEYYKRSIDADATQGVNYLALHELYRYSYKQNTAAAADILKKGIANVSGNQIIDLYSALGSYYQAKNDRTNAIFYLTYARDAAQKAGNTMLAAQFNDELATLKK